MQIYLKMTVLTDERATGLIACQAPQAPHYIGLDRGN